MSSADDYREELERYLKGFGHGVRRVRLEKSPYYSQERLANATRLHRTEIGKIEQGTVEPRLTTLVILAHGLSVGLDDLVADLWVPVERKPSARAGSRLHQIHTSKPDWRY